jgi:hypothetical protein
MDISTLGMQRHSTAEVTVLLHTKGANIWVIQLGEDPNLWGDEIAGTAPTMFGHRPRDVAAGAAPACLIRSSIGSSTTAHRELHCQIC